MVQSNAYDRYKENAILTSRPEELTLMLFNGLVKYIMQGIHAIEKKEIEKAHDSIVRAQEIINELSNSLDKKYDISKSLDLLYDYMYRRLVEANVSKDIAVLNEVLDYSKELRDAWTEAMKASKISNIQPAK